MDMHLKGEESSRRELLQNIWGTERSVFVDEVPRATIQSLSLL
jgi:hypothetical protein